ncbi:MAG: hypothetical protein WD425_05495 [Nitrospirales bacterium]
MMKSLLRIAPDSKKVENQFTLRQDDNGHYHRKVRLTTEPYLVRLSWRASKDSSIQPVGLYELDLHGLLDAGYIRYDPKGGISPHVRIRVVKEGEKFFMQTDSAGPAIEFPREFSAANSDQHDDAELESFTVEGKQVFRYGTAYERDPKNRAKAIEIHGTACMVCGLDFGEKYGDWGEGFIHVHHNKPISEAGEVLINPAKDLSVVCPNCHAMIHRKRNETLSIEDLRGLIEKCSRRDRPEAL